MLLGKDTVISTLDVQRLLVPLETELGQFQIVLALREGISNSLGETVADNGVRAGT